MTGTPVTGTPVAGAPTAAPAPERRRRRFTSSFVFLRQVPGTSPVHRLWAGTKILVVAALGLSVSFIPTWPTIGIVAAFVVGAGLVARVTIGALPRFPLLFWAFMAFGAALTLVAGGAPYVHVGGASVGLAALDQYLRFTAIGLELIGASAMIGWTTPVGDVAPALARLGRPLRWLRMPVDEWSVAIALCFRSLPLLIDELRTLVAARRLRPNPFQHRDARGGPPVDAEAPDGRGPVRWVRLVFVETADLLSACLAVAMRRAGELAEAITARGGTMLVPSTRPGPSWRDVLALTGTAGACGASIAVYALS